MTTVRLEGSLWKANMVSALAASGVLALKIEGMAGWQGSYTREITCLNGKENHG
jgi:hypothetical protein